MLFEEGDFIFYGSGGICRVESVCEMPFEGAKEGVPYYILHTLSEPKQTIMNPIDNDRVLMRAVMTADEAKNVLDSLPSAVPFEAPNAKALREQYITAIKSADPREWARVLVTYESRRRKTEAKLARVTEAERGFYNQAFSLLSAEAALVTGTAIQSIMAKIAEIMKNELKNG